MIIIIRHIIVRIFFVAFKIIITRSIRKIYEIRTLPMFAAIIFLFFS